MFVRRYHNSCPFKAPLSTASRHHLGLVHQSVATLAVGHDQKASLCCGPSASSVSSDSALRTEVALAASVATVRYKGAMAARHPPAEPRPRFSKGQVNRAGALLLDLSARMATDGAERAVAESDEAELAKAWDALTWWRSLHAYPLSTVAANLRYHVDRGGGRVRGKLEVTQRLKRMDTLIGKLAREPGSVTRMQDIGGVRAFARCCRTCSTSTPSGGGSSSPG